MEQKKELEERVVMSHKNTSDSIEEYIKAILAQAGIAELKRSEIADVFQVVPSQINYVIKTRFTESRGYVVASVVEAATFGLVGLNSLIIMSCFVIYCIALASKSVNRSLQISFSYCLMKKS